MKKWSHRTADIANKLLVVYFVLGSALFFLTILLLSARGTPQSSGYLLIFLGLGFLGSLFAFGRFVTSRNMPRISNLLSELKRPSDTIFK